jgi:DNA polymerase I
LDSQVKKMQDTITDRIPEARKWKEKYGGATNFQSPDQLADILFNELGYESENKTAGGKPSTAEANLEKIDSDLTRWFFDMKRLIKLKNTYFGNILREQVDGLLKPFFKLALVDTFRSSSSNINFQNQPSRNPEMMTQVRRSFRPSSGRLFTEGDYGGIEVKIAACYHKDPTMITYIEDPTKDMHRDMAIECYMLESDQWTKQSRYCAKNKYVFPEFYGSYYAQCAKDLWSAIDQFLLTTKDGVPMREHLRKNGIKNYKQYESYIQKVENHFWDDRFPVYRDWKDKWVADYNQNGYFISKTGFRVSGLLSRNQIINYPIQGSAFHCLLWSLIRLNKWIKREGLQSKIIGQVHDSGVFDTCPEEANALFSEFIKIGTETIRLYWPWIIVPMDIEIECSPIDQGWDAKKEVVKAEPCSDCGLEWAYQKDGDYLCPVCDYREGEK